MRNPNLILKFKLDGIESKYLDIFDGETYFDRSGHDELITVEFKGDTKEGLRKVVKLSICSPEGASAYVGSFDERLTLKQLEQMSVISLYGSRARVDGLVGDDIKDFIRYWLLYKMRDWSINRATSDFFADYIVSGKLLEEENVDKRYLSIPEMDLYIHARKALHPECRKKIILPPMPFKIIEAYNAFTPNAIDGKLFTFSDEEKNLINYLIDEISNPSSPFKKIFDKSKDGDLELEF